MDEQGKRIRAYSKIRKAHKCDSQAEVEKKSGNQSKFSRLHMEANKLRAEGFRIDKNGAIAAMKLYRD